MDEFTALIGPKTLGHLGRIVGSTWKCVGTPGIVIDNLITCPALIVTSKATVALSILDNEVLKGGEYRTLTMINEVAATGSIDAAMDEGTVFVHGEGERVTSVTVIREELQAFSEGAETFRLLSDSGMVIALETMVISVQRRGFDGFDFVVNRAQSLAELEFYPTDRDWPMSRKVTYEYARHMISLQSPGSEGAR